MLHTGILMLAVGLSDPARIDLSQNTALQTTVDKESGQYLGHPTTLLLPDGTTIICIYPKGHGRGPLVWKRSSDGGQTWSERLKTPASWATSQETPHLYAMHDAEGTQRLVLFSGLYPVRTSISEDDGQTWSELEAIGDFGGIVAVADVMSTGRGSYTAFFHDDGRFIARGGKASGSFKVTQSIPMMGE